VDVTSKEEARTTRELEGRRKFRKKWKEEEWKRTVDGLRMAIGNRRMSTALIKRQVYFAYCRIYQLNNTFRFGNINANKRCIFVTFWNCDQVPRWNFEIEY
jgi:hypothetical protein